MFGLHWRLVFFFDHGTLWPKPGRLAQMSHTAAMGQLLELWGTGTESAPRNLARIT
jgi:hypothetical protein